MRQPMRMRTQPPKASATLPQRELSRLPKVIPIAVKVAATTPMTTQQDSRDTRIKAILRPDPQGVQTGRHREEDEHPAFGRVRPVGFALLLLEHGVQEHLTPNEAEQSEDDPVVVGGDIDGNAFAGHVPENGHYELEQAEVKRQGERRVGG